MTNTYKFADRIVKVSSIYDDIHVMCREYLCTGAEDFSVEILQSDIDFERKKSADEDKAENRTVRNFPDSYLESLAVYRKIADKMLEYDTVLFHGSVVAVDGMGYLFTATSGTGKSTHTRLWREYFGERAVMINDDKPLIHIGKNGITVYGTPWDGKHRLSTNASVPLKSICILTRSTTNHIKQIAKHEAYATLIQQTNRPKNPEKMLKTLSLIDNLAERVSLYFLGCNMNIQAVEVAYNAMK